MKKAYQIISVVSITVFAISVIVRWFDVMIDYNTVENGNFFVLIYFYTRMKYLELELKEIKTEKDSLKPNSEMQN